MSILTELKDPRVEHVTVTFVEVSPDMRQAKVHVSVMGDDTKQKLCLQGLQSSAGFLQTKVGKRIDTRYTPKLRFELDMGVKKSLAIAQLLHDVLPAEGEGQIADESLADETPGHDSLEDPDDVPAEADN